MQRTIHPIAIDLGAKHTGVFTAQYKSGHALKDNKEHQIQQKGYVYNLDKKNYTLLMTERTQARHQRRGYDRRQMVKRLFKVIWEKHFRLEWDSDVQQTISFLFNRRGFSYLSGEYDAVILSQFPDEAYKNLPDELKIDGDRKYDHHDFDAALQEWSKDQSKLKSVLDILTTKHEQAKDEPAWKFKISDFKLEKNLKNFDDEKKYIKTHLHHLTYAIYKTHEELNTGARHRSKYFAEVDEILSSKNHTDSYLKNFQSNLQKGKYDNLNFKKLSNLIGNLSNLELKPLRKYFNDKEHCKEDYWDEQRFKRIYFNWIIQQWRVNPSKDKDKAVGAAHDYSKLKDKIKASNSVVSFLLNSDPNWTIPPYQDNNNRRPPHCQSLILNTKFLNDRYPDWREWLKQLKQRTALPCIEDYLGDFTATLKELKTGNNNKYFSDTDSIDARVLQFIFDRVKDSDVLYLNEIYSHAKKFKQQESSAHEKKEAKSKLEEAIANSKLPDALKTPRNYNNDAIFAEKSFLHLVNKYYKLRQKARDGRIFIHPEYREVKRRGYECYKDTGKFNDENHLLTYCNCKPRQKRYQLLNDIAGLLKLPPERVRQCLNIEASDDEEGIVSNWLSGIHGLKSNADKAAEAQKKHRGELKEKIRATVSSIKQGAVKKLPKEFKDLRSLCDKAKGLHKAVYESLGEPKECNDTVASVYFLAQIYNIAFTDRSGNANTCAICSADNAQRMQMNGGMSKASRLPAIATRVIDGAVKRMARIISNKIVEHEWGRIEKQLKADHKVSVPIITESNRFEFEPALKDLKGKLKDKKQATNNADIKFLDKNKRIRKDSGKYCPYTGEKLTDSGEEDHIIPRSSRHGILNDEANLIYASERGNQKKAETEYSLKDLHHNYKKSQFESKSDNEITKWIEETIGDGKDGFTFGRYFNFINLNDDQRKAFRHALFLSKSHPLRDKVIQALSNRNRAFVNGTQRYFAQVLANNLHRRAKLINKENNICFDYFGIRTTDDSHIGVSQLRHEFENSNHIVDKYKKDEHKQKAYSHLIDAQLTFCIALDKHKNNGSFKLITNKHKLQPRDSAKTIFDAIMVAEQDMKEHDLERRKPRDGFNSHRSFARDTMYALNYLPILFKPNGDDFEVRAGFTSANSALFKTNKKGTYKHEKQILQIIQYCTVPNDLQDKRFEDLTSLYEELGKHKQFSNQLRKHSYYYLAVDKQKLHEHLMTTYNASSGTPTTNDKFFKFCNEISYRTEKKKIEKPENLGIKESDFEINPSKACDGVVDLPAKQEWEKLRQEWNRNSERTDFNSFMSKHFGRGKTCHAHQRAKKKYSLPVITRKGELLLIRRKGWNKATTHQLVQYADSAGNKPALPVFVKEHGRGQRLAKWIRSKNVMILKHHDYDKDGVTIDPQRWFEVSNLDTDIKPPVGVEKIEYRIPDNSRPQIRVYLSKDGQGLSNDILSHALCKARYRDKAKEQIESASAKDVIDFPGLGYSDCSKEVLNKVLKTHYTNMQ